MRQLDGKVARVPEAGHGHPEVRPLIDPARPVAGYGATAVEAGVVPGHAVPLPLCLATA